MSLSEVRVQGAEGWRDKRLIVVCVVGVTCLGDLRSEPSDKLVLVTEAPAAVCNEVVRRHAEPEDAVVTGGHSREATPGDRGSTHAQPEGRR